MSKKQMVWHAYHAGSLCQYVDIEARRAKIEEIKPEHELSTRRRLMKPVIGQLPKGFVEACEREDAAQDALREAWDAAWEAAVWETAAWEVRDARKAREARKAALHTHEAEIEQLHALECPDCPWDGETIFPELIDDL